MATVNIDPRKLQHEFKHAGDFGIQGNWNPANASAFEQAIRDHVASPSVRVIPGTYRGTIVVRHYFDPQTWLWVALEDGTDQLVACWRLSPNQVAHLNTTQNIQ